MSGTILHLAVNPSTSRLPHASNFGGGDVANTNRMGDRPSSQARISQF